LRTGVHRYTGAGAVLIDLGKTLSGGEIDQASIEVGATEITGQLHHLGGMTAGFGGYTVHFVIRGAWTEAQTWSDAAAPSSATTASGTGVGAALTVGPETTLAIGISLVSLEGARKNLDAEVPAIDFDTVAATARAAWSSQLSTVLVTGGSEAERRIFYTSLYHAFLMPSVIEDVDHQYVFAGGTPRLSDGWQQMSDLSLWDTYRTVHPLYAWLAPTSAKDSARSLVSFGDGIGIFPKWPLATGETGTMLGASAEIVIADTTLRGIDVDADLAWPALRAAAMDVTAPPAGRGGRNDVEHYIELGFVPRDRGVGRTVSLTTEFSHDDFALANLAAHLGNPADADALRARSRGWRMLFDPTVGFLRGRNQDGSFPTESFDPLELGDDYAEANAWHSLWMAGAHDPDGLAEMFGGNAGAVAKLEEFFDNAKLDFDTADESAANFPRPYYWHGNEPDMNAAYVFAQLGRPDLTATWVRWIQDSLYSDQPSGVAGNDDGGTLGAWYVLSALGAYPIPGSDRWILGTPRFPQARVLVGGRELIITADENGEPGTVEIDGVAVTAGEITHAQLVDATSLHFVIQR
jgi:predicted alpha-1,2-mannosidase